VRFAPASTWTRIYAKEPFNARNDPRPLYLPSLFTSLFTSIQNPSLIAKWHHDFDVLENTNQSGLWDIDLLAAQGISTPNNSGILPDGQHTVTVQGKVFDDAEVDYYLYGIIFNIAGISPADGLIVPGWRLFNNIYNGDPAPLNTYHRLAWFMAGYSGNWNYADAAAIPGVSPAPAPPVGEDCRPLQWHIDGTKGSN
jgi:hypothetical protein